MFIKVDKSRQKVRPYTPDELNHILITALYRVSVRIKAPPTWQHTGARSSLLDPAHESVQWRLAWASHSASLLMMLSRWTENGFSASRMKAQPNNGSRQKRANELCPSMTKSHSIGLDQTSGRYEAETEEWLFRDHFLHARNAVRKDERFLSQVCETHRCEDGQDGQLSFVQTRVHRRPAPLRILITSSHSSWGTHKIT